MFGLKKKFLTYLQKVRFCIIIFTTRAFETQCFQIKSHFVFVTNNRVDNNR